MTSYKKLVNGINDNNCDALIIFCDSTSLWFLRILKPNYRHCFIAVKSGADWIVYEPLLSRTELTILRDSKAIEVRRCFEAMGCEVIGANMNRTKPIRKSLFAPFTCVRAVGRILGMNMGLVWTPYQLYKKIIKQRK